MSQTFHMPDVVAGCMRLGLWGANFTTIQYQAFIEDCLDIGITTFDHADIYGNYTTEAEFGLVLKNQSHLRQQIQLITKCGIEHPCEQRPQYHFKAYNTSANHIRNSVEQSLKNFNTDYIDLLLIHRPDVLMNAQEIAQTITQLKQEGKVIAFGVSNFTASQFELLYQLTPLVTNQIEVSLFQRAAFNNGTLNQCQSHNIRPMAWSPLAGGQFLQNSQLNNSLNEIAANYGVSSAKILYAFLAKHPAKMIPVTGTTKASRVVEAVEAQTIELSNQTWYQLWQAATGKEIA